MATRRTRSADGARLSISVTLRGATADETRPDLAAYAFSGGGELIEHVVLKAGKGELPLKAREGGQAVRVMIGIAPVDEQVPSLGDLVRQGAKEYHIKVGPGIELSAITAIIDPTIWRCWLQFCYVTGTLLKRVNRDGISIDMPVCNATVDIWEVEPIELILARIPPELLEWLRTSIVKPPPVTSARQFGTRFPPPGPGPDPGPFLAISSLGGVAPPVRGPSALDTGFEIATSASARSEGESEGARAPAAARSSGPTAEAQVDPRAIAAAMHSLAGVHAISSAAHSGELDALRAALVAHQEIFRPLLCLLFPHWVTKQFITAVQTDECGHFSAYIWKGCRTLNLYFTAWQWFFGGFDPVPIQILAPTPISCYTWWNYQCGSEVTLYTTSLFARTCAPCAPVVADPRWVIAMAMGNFPMSRVHGLSSSTPVSGSDAGLTDGGAPFGGTMRLRLEFDDALLGLGVGYYQVSWKKAGTAGAPVPLNGDVHRHYAHDVGGNVVVEVYTLGPKTVNGSYPLYEIPPALPPEGDWSYPDAVQDLSSAVFPSASLVPAPFSGLIELHVDLFDTSGNPVDISTLGINYVVPTSTDFSGTILTENAAVDGLVSGNTLVLPFYVDNNACSALIDPPLLNGTPASEDCGVLRYNQGSPGSVTLSYHAHHPNGFATYSYALYRGVNELTPPSQSGLVGAGDFTDTETVAALMGTCTVAGFSENLYVAAMAIDGWSRLSQYDAGYVLAFALAPH